MTDGSDLVRKFAIGAAAAAVLFVMPGYPALKAALLERDILVRVAYILSSHTEPSEDAPVLLLIDDETLRREAPRGLDVMGRERSYLAEMIEALVDRPPASRPASVALNVLLDRIGADPEADDRLERALRSAVSAGVDVVLASRLISWHGGVQPILPLQRFLVSEHGVTTGYTNLLRSPHDGAVRKADVAVEAYGAGNIAWLHESGRGDEASAYWLLTDEDRQARLLYPSFSAALIKARTDLPADSVFGRDLLKPFWIDFRSAPHRTFAVRSAFRLFRGDLDRLIAGRVVIIGKGVTGSSTRDKTALSVSTPFFARVPLVGAIFALNAVVDQDLLTTEVQGYVLDTLERETRRKTRRVGGVGAVLVVEAIVLALLVAAYRIPRFRRTAAVAFMTLPVAYVALAVVGFLAGHLALPITTPIAAWIIVLAAPGWWHSRLVIAARSYMR